MCKDINMPMCQYKFDQDWEKFSEKKKTDLSCQIMFS